MKLIAEIDGIQNEVNLKREGNKVYAEIEGRNYELQASEPESNIYLLKNKGKIYEVFVSPIDNQNETYKAYLGSNNFEINLIDPKKLRGTNAGVGLADGIAEIKTAMPGKIVKILMQKNSEVKSGEGVIIVEAMKMQNEMKAPKDGLIKEIKFNEGDTVNAGDVLVVIE